MYSDVQIDRIRGAIREFQKGGDTDFDLMYRVKF